MRGEETEGEGAREGRRQRERENKREELCRFWECMLCLVKLET